MVDPISYGEEGVAAKAIDAEAGIVFRRLPVYDFHDAGTAQNAEMAAHGRPADGTPGGELAGGEVALAEDLHYAEARGVGEGGEGSR